MGVHSRPTAATRLKLWAACVSLGATYCAVLGALLAGAASWGVGAYPGIILGGLLGAAGGCVTGALLLLLGNRLGWDAAALLGGLVPGLLLIDLADAFSRLSYRGGMSEGTEDLLSYGLFVLLPALIAVFLGIAVARALRADQSRVPGVQRLVEAVNEVREQSQGGGRPGGPAEVIPAGAPVGRGDEAAPCAADSSALPGASIHPAPPVAPVATVALRPRPAAALAAAAVLLLCLAPLWLTPCCLARYTGRSADLHGAWLICAPLRAAYMKAAHLEGAILVKAMLADSVLREANLRGAHLWGADLSGASLRGADLHGADLRRADLRRADLRASLGEHADVYRVTSLKGADLRGTDLRGARYDRYARWPKGFDPQRHGALLIGPHANLARASLRGVLLLHDDLTGANLAAADLRDAELDRTILRGANLCGANLALAALTSVDLTGARYDARTRWPAGYNPRKDGAVLAR